MQPAPTREQLLTAAVESSMIITRYPLASRNKRHPVERERTIYLQGNPDTGYSFYGAFYGPAGQLERQAAVNLAGILLEIAMSQTAPGLFDQGAIRVRYLGRLLGHTLARRLIQDLPGTKSIDRVVIGLESILRSLDASWSKHFNNLDICYQITRCPLVSALEHEFFGSDVNLAHFGLTSMCDSLAHTIDPTFSVHFPDGPEANHYIYLPLSSIR